MNLAILIPIFLAAGSDRIELPVTLKTSSSSSCGFPQPGDVSLEWKDDNTVIAKATVSDNVTFISEDSPRAHLEGAQLKICYNTYTRPRVPNAPTSMCEPPEYLSFTISNLPRGNYEPHVFRCDSPKVLYYKCIAGGKATYTIYETPNCTPVFSENK